MEVFPYGDQGKAPPEWGLDPNAVKVVTVPLAVARVTPVKFESLNGSVIWAVRASSLTALCEIRLQNERNDPIPFGAGQFIRGVRYSRVFITNVAQAGEWIQFLVAKETPTRLQIENPSIYYNVVNLAPATVLDTAADVVVVAAAAAAQILPALATRRAAFICSLAANTQVCRIGDALTAAARGQELAIGATMILSTTEAIYAYTAAGANQTLTLTWTAD